MTMSHRDAMSGIGEAENASRERRPTVRSRYTDDQELEGRIKSSERWKLGQDVWIKGARRVDPAVHQIDKVLGEGHYQLSRQGKVVRNKADTGPHIYKEEELQGKPPSPRFKSDQTVYVKGERGVNPAPYKIHKVLDDGLYQLSKDDKLELNEDGKTPKEYPEDGLQTHQ